MQRMDGAQLPDVVLSILSLGNWGVDIFLLVSGIGMYYSISKKVIILIGRGGF